MSSGDERAAIASTCIGTPASAPRLSAATNHFEMRTEQAAEVIVSAVRPLLAHRTEPLCVALDGPSGSGKSTLARHVAHDLGGAIIPLDDFFAASLTDVDWDARGPHERADAAVDWRRLRREALDPLIAGIPARWRTFDFAAGVRQDGSYPMRTDFIERAPARLVLLDGAYSARPELSDVVHFSVLVEAPAAVRRQRLAAREDASSLEAWHSRWDVVEAYYFTHVRPSSTFDLVVSHAVGPNDVTIGYR